MGMENGQEQMAMYMSVNFMITIHTDLEFMKQVMAELLKEHLQKEN